MFQSAWFEQQAGALTESETAYRHVLAIGKQGTHDDRLLFSHFGLGDILIAREHIETSFDRVQQLTVRNLIEPGELRRLDLELGQFAVEPLRNASIEQHAAPR